MALVNYNNRHSCGVTSFGLLLVLTYKYRLLNTYKNIIHIYIMTETTNLADNEKFSKILQYVFKKESILTESEFKSEVKSILDSALKSIQSESEESESESESELEKEEQPSVKDEDIDIRNKSYEDNYINNK